MAETINIATKSSGDTLTASEFNQVVEKTNSAISEMNENKTESDLHEETQDTAIANKVNKVEGKGLSTNDYTNDDKTKLGEIDHQSSSIVEWVNGEASPVVEADKYIGEFIEGKKHLVTILTFDDETTLAFIKLENFDEQQELTFDFAFNGTVRKALTQPDGKLLVAGEFDGKLKRFNADGTEDAAFTTNLPAFAQSISTITLLDNGKMLVAKYDGSVVQINADGTLDSEFAGLELALFQYEIAVQDDGKILAMKIDAGGYLKRYNTDCTEDAAFNANVPVLNHSFYSLVLQVDGKILIGGGFDGYLKRLNTDGTEDAAFNANIPALDWDIWSISLQDDGKLIIGGSFTGQLKRINADGTEDAAFNANIPAFDDRVFTTVLQPDGKIIIGGAFTGHLKRINADGTEDADFNANIPILDDEVYTVGMMEDETIVLGGIFANSVKWISAQGLSTISLNTSYLKSLLAKKVDKVTGKGLSTENFTTAEKNKLAGIPDLYIEKTYAEAVIAIGNGTLVPGATYKITDRGDLGLFFTAISTTQFAATGTRLMLCPATYAPVADGNGNTWIGVWNDTKAANVNELAIWGGKVWNNLTGAIGTADNDVNLDGVNWAEVTKVGFVNGEYIEMSFGVQFDWENDWISKQWDGGENVVGIDYLREINDEELGFNVCDVTDWNIGTIDYFRFYNNQCPLGIYNNVSTGGIYRNAVEKIINNASDVEIYENKSNESIDNNSLNYNIFSCTVGISGYSGDDIAREVNKYPPFDIGYSASYSSMLSDAYVTLQGNMDEIRTYAPEGWIGYLLVIQNGTGGYGITAFTQTGLTTIYKDGNAPVAANINSAPNGKTLIKCHRFGLFLFVSFELY